MNNNKVIMMKKLFEMTVAVVAVVIALMVVLITTTSLFVASGYTISVLFRFSLLDSTMLCIGAGFVFSILVIGLIVAKKRSFDIFKSIDNDEDYFDIYTPKRTTTSRKKKI